MKTTPERLAELKALAVDSDLSGIDSITTRLDILHEKDEARARAYKEYVPTLIADLEEAQRRSSITEAFAKELSSDLIATRKLLAEAQAFIKSISDQLPEKPDHWSSCGQCQSNSSSAEDFLNGDTSALTALISEAVADEKRNPWKLAIINELINSHILTKEHEDNPIKALAALVDYECQVALDPAVSKEAQALIELYRKDAERYRQIFASSPYVYTICVYGAPCIDKATADAFLDQKLAVSNKTISPGDG